VAGKAFSPLISGGFLTFFMWLFIIIALASIIWFIAYVNNSKVQNAKTVFSAVLVSALSTAVALTFITVKYHIHFW